MWQILSICLLQCKSKLKSHSPLHIKIFVRFIYASPQCSLSCFLQQNTVKDPNISNETDNIYLWCEFLKEGQVKVQWTEHLNKGEPCTYTSITSIVLRRHGVLRRSWKNILKQIQIAIIDYCLSLSGQIILYLRIYYHTPKLPSSLYNTPVISISMYM